MLRTQGNWKLSQQQSTDCLQDTLQLCSVIILTMSMFSDGCTARGLPLGSVWTIFTHRRKVCVNKILLLTNVEVIPKQTLHIIDREARSLLL